MLIFISIRFWNGWEPSAEPLYDLAVGVDPYAAPRRIAVP
jgi:hypothetical protein